MARTHTYLAAIGRLTACGKAYGCASDAAAKAIELDPDLEDSHVALALVRLFHDWDLPACEASFLRAMSIKPDSVEVLHGYSLYFTAAGRHEEAVTVLEKAATIDPLNLPVRDHLARVYMATERFDDALAQFDRVMELDPEFRAALEGKGFTYMVMDRLDDALATFEQVRELTPHPKGGITPLAIALALAGRTTEAEELLTIIEEREREEPDVSLDLDFASVYWALGRSDEAMARLRKAAESRIGALVFLRHSPSWYLGQLEGVSELLAEHGL